jgi:hypothetical protein
MIMHRLLLIEENGKAQGTAPKHDYAGASMFGCQASFFLPQS